MIFNFYWFDLKEERKIYYLKLFFLFYEDISQTFQFLTRLICLRIEYNAEGVRVCPDETPGQGRHQNPGEGQRSYTRTGKLETMFSYHISFS